MILLLRRRAISSGVQPDVGGFMACQSVSYAYAWTTCKHELWAGVEGPWLTQ